MTAKSKFRRCKIRLLHQLTNKIFVGLLALRCLKNGSPLADLQLLEVLMHRTKDNTKQACSEKLRLLLHFAVVFLFVLALGGCMQQGQVDLAFDSGGTSLDLSQCLIGSGESEGENLFPQDRTAVFNARNDPFGWKQGINNKGLDLEHFDIELEEGVLSISHSLDLAKHLDSRGEPSLSSGAYRVIPVPDGGSYTLSFDAGGELWRGAGNSQAVVAWRMLNDKQERISDEIRNRIPLKPGKERCALEVAAPESTRHILVVFRLYGLGNVHVENIDLRKRTLHKEITVDLYPQTYMGNTFALASGQAGTLYFMQSNKTGMKLDKPELHLELPEGVELLGGSFLYEPVLISGNHWSLPLEKCSISEKDYRLPPIVIRTQLPAGETLYPVTYYSSNAGIEGTRKTFSIKVIETISGIRPKRFMSGFYSTSLHRFNQPVFASLLDFYVQCGFNAVKGGYTADMLKGYSDAGFTMAWWSTRPGPNDGYDMGAPDKPREVSYILADGSVLKGGRCGPFLCPQVAVEKGEHYREHVIKPLQKIIRENKYDLIMNNWEPQDSFRGCFCERCREAFIRYSKLDPETVRAAWPKEVLNNWRALWPGFRSWQHGQMMANFEEDVSAVGAHFVPDITSESMREASYQLYHHYNTEEFIDKLPWICAWGPYLYHDMKLPYTYNNAQYLRVFLNARQVNEFVAKRIPEPAKRPKLITFPHQNQCFTWVTVPEAPAFENQTYFINGWEGSLIYFLPLGADHLTFKMLAESNRAIAAVEDFVFDGRSCPDPLVEAVTPLPASHYMNSKDARLPGLEDAALIQSAAWQLGQQRLIGVGNFWQKGEVFFKLRIDDLEDTGRYCLDLPLHKTRFTGENGKYFTGMELKKGVLLQVGGFRWNFYVLSSYGDNEAVSAIYRPLDVQRQMQRRLPEIQKAINWENQYAESLHSSFQQDEKPDYGKFTSKSHDGVIGSRKDGIATFQMADQVLQINLLQGSAIDSWTVAGKELCAPEFSFAREGAWVPNAFMVKGPFQFIDLSEIPGGLELKLQRRISPLETISYPGLVIHKIYQITALSVKVISKIENSSGESQTLAFRWHNLPGDRFQKLSFGMDRFDRAFDIRGYRVSKTPGEFTTGRKGNNKAIGIQDSIGTFSGKDGNLILSFDPQPASELDIFITWGGNIAGDSFEPIFFPVTLNAGTSVSYSLEMKVNQ